MSRHQPLDKKPSTAGGMSDMLEGGFGEERSTFSL